MRRVLRIAFIVIGVLVLLVAIAPFVISVDSFRPTIEQKASAVLGRSVHLGRLSLSLFSGTLSAEEISIGDDPAFGSGPFLTAKALKVGVELRPLIFSRSLRVTDVTIDAPEVTLMRNRAGQWNFASLAVAGGASGGARSQATPDVSISKLELVNGRLVVGRTGSEKRSTYDHVTLTMSDVSLTSEFPLSLAADLPAGGTLKLAGHAGPLDRTDASLTPIGAKLDVKSLNLASTGFLDASSGLGGIVDLDATLESRGGEADTKGAATLSKALLVAGGSPAGVPVTVNFDTKYSLRSAAGVLNPSVLKIGNAAAHLDGTYNTAGEETVVQIKLRASDMPARDLEAFLPAIGLIPPKGATLSSGTLSADLQIAGPANKLVTSGNVGLFNAVLSNFDLGAKMSTVAKLAGINTGKDLDIEKLTADLRVAPNGIEARSLLAVVSGLGSLTGAGTVDARNALDFKMVAVISKATGAAAPAPAPAATPAPKTSGGLAGLGSLGGLGGKLGNLGGTLGNLGGVVSKVTGAACQGGMTVPFQIKGTMADPKFVPDVGGLAAATLKSKLGCL